MKKILLAEDHPLLVIAVTVLQSAELKDTHLDVVMSCNELMKVLKKNNYDLAILDIQLFDGTTMHLIPDILKLYPSLPILVFSSYPEELYAQKLYQDGVRGFLSKQADSKEMLFAMKRILDGKTYMSENFIDFLLAKENSTVSPFTQLSQRESEVAMLLLQGKRTSEISRELNLQPSTVATNKMKIFTKLKVKNVLELEQVAKNFNIKPTT